MQEKSTIVTDHRTLRGMEIQGYILRNGLPTTREKHWTGQRVKVFHVSPGPKLRQWYDIFTYRKVEYRLHYFDGCFHPFVTRVDCASNLPKVV